MLTTSCCLKVQNGIIALVDEPEEINTINGHNIEVEKKDYGVNIIVGNLTIPIPEKLFDYLAENPIIAVYQLKRYSYVAEPDLIINLDKLTLMLLRGICQHHSYSYMGDAVTAVCH
ncbi:MAG TPA: hypothetical protein VJL89_00605 [Thermodesulfovibrionia bacterium]|nr:hypothetical protein [Thermodesulfovibrionia bacterium]